MPRKQKKYYYIYRTTCLVTNKYYIGMHATDNLEDQYLGSGKRLWYSLNKYGRDNHVLEILEYCDCMSSLKDREACLVTKELLKDPLCMNLALGGGGGWYNKETQLKCSKAGGNATVSSRKKNTDLQREHIERFSKMVKNNHSNGKYSNVSRFKGKSHSEETKEKIGSSNSTKQKGSANSQYGTCWITDGRENKKIYKGCLIPKGWRLGRKIKLIEAV